MNCWNHCYFGIWVSHSQTQYCHHSYAGKEQKFLLPVAVSSRAHRWPSTCRSISNSSCPCPHFSCLGNAGSCLSCPGFLPSVFSHSTFPAQSGHPKAGIWVQVTLLLLAKTCLHTLLLCHHYQVAPSIHFGQKRVIWHGPQARASVVGFLDTVCFCEPLYRYTCGVYAWTCVQCQH